MDDLSLEKETTKLEKYLKERDRGDFIDAIRSADFLTLDAKLLGLAKHREEIKNTKARDNDLKKASETKKNLEAPYREQMRMNEKLARFVALIMQEKGLE